MQADPRQLIFLKSLFSSFVDLTGLKVNYRKSQMLPINVSPEKMEHLAQTIGCAIGTLPFTYLGLPNGHHKTENGRSDTDDE